MAVVVMPHLVRTEEMLGPEVQAALTKGTDLRQYSAEIETALRSVERASIQDYLQESESLAGLHTQIVPTSLSAPICLCVHE